MDQQTSRGNQKLQVEPNYQTKDDKRKYCCNILNLRLDPVACMKNIFTLVNVALKEKSKGAYTVVILDVGLFIFFWLISSIQ